MSRKSYINRSIIAILAMGSILTMNPIAHADDNNNSSSNITVEFKPITIQARQDVGSIKLAEKQAKDLDVASESAKQATIQQVKSKDLASTPSGTDEDLSYKIKEALNRADSLIQKREEANKAVQEAANTVLPPVLDENGDVIESNLADIVNNLSSNGSSGKTLKELNLPHDDSLASKVVDSALSRLGIPYVWGGESMAEGGYDCSGLMQYAYAQNGISISRTTYTQVNEGTAVSSSDLKPGDLVFYSGMPPEHVAMYIGDGKVVHAPYTGTVIQIADVNMMPISAARRII